MKRTVVIVNGKTYNLNNVSWIENKFKNGKKIAYENSAGDRMFYEDGIKYEYKMGEYYKDGVLKN